MCVCICFLCMYLYTTCFGTGEFLSHTLETPMYGICQDSLVGTSICVVIKWFWFYAAGRVLRRYHGICGEVLACVKICPCVKPGVFTCVKPGVFICPCVKPGFPRFGRCECLDLVLRAHVLWIRRCQTSEGAQAPLSARFKELMNPRNAKKNKNKNKKKWGRPFRWPRMGMQDWLL